jgi:uncharacterized protein YecE (DUF72 family)
LDRSAKRLKSAYVGCSGWNYKHWRGRFYPLEFPQRRWFEHYCGLFSTVELNNSFYRLPSAQTMRQWESQAPDGFVYAVKANRFLTHMRKLKDCKIPLERFLRRARLLKTHLGPILYQLPPRWKLNSERLQQFLHLLPKDIKHVFEFRDPTWFVPEIRSLLSQYGASFCCHDMPGLDVPRWVTGEVVYVRFHGSDAKYQGCYPRRTLTEWSEWLRLQHGGRKIVYAYFNNDAEAHAVKDALKLQRILQPKENPGS